MSRYAYCWLLMRGDRYLPGILTSCYSVRSTNTEHDLVVLVTKDVSKNAIKEIKKICDKVKVVDYIEYKYDLSKRKKMNKKYGTWMSVSPTKWNALNLIEYEKIFFLDADVIVTKNIDSVFKEKRIAATFYNPWSNRYIKNSAIKDYYKNKKIINKKLIKKSITKSGYVFFATSVLIHPSKDLFKNYKKMLEEVNFNKMSKCYSGIDEITLSYFMSNYKYGPQQSWKNLSQCYQYIPWHKNNCCRKQKLCKKIKVIHIFGDILPWESKLGVYDDIDMWLYLYEKMLQNTNVNLKSKNKKFNEKNKYIKFIKNKN